MSLELKNKITDVFKDSATKLKSAALATMLATGVSTLPAGANDSIDTPTAKFQTASVTNSTTKDYLANGYAGSPYGKSTSYSENGRGVGVAVFLGRSTIHSEEVMKNFFETSFDSKGVPSKAFVVRDPDAAHTRIVYSFNGDRSKKTYDMENKGDGYHEYAALYWAFEVKRKNNQLTPAEWQYARDALKGYENVQVKITAAQEKIARPSLAAN